MNVPTSLTVSYSDIAGGFAGTGNINADPVYLNPASGDLRLSPASPAINAGTTGASVPTTDFLGNPRDMPPDMGAYEYELGTVSNTAINPTQGVLFSGNVATFTDSDGEMGASGSFTATIDWGDGTGTTTGTVTQPGGPGTAYAVSGSHTYATSGLKTLTVTIQTNGSPIPETGQGSNTITVNAPPPTTPAFTSANSITFTVGTPGSFMVTATGMPLPTISESGTLPSGVTFNDNGNGTATLQGTPATSGTFTLTFTASNGDEQLPFRPSR